VKRGGMEFYWIISGAVFTLGVVVEWFGVYLGKIGVCRVNS